MAAVESLDDYEHCEIPVLEEIGGLIKEITAVIANFILLGLICLGCAIASSIYYSENTSAQYFEFGSDASNAALAGFLTFW
ncbi:hypothetical protein BC937DRAFT_95536 [Endogone sp. FLAS-F59071]|nr:hypothetical protein BC937DRAFT_95536 [Endogone sp. FLAS-F59071]|eukprot:RUS20287.1 hypothetical protein BC937DRAFT_95536 [Endogone sp. FLAS-F59071]